MNSELSYEANFIFLTYFSHMSRTFLGLWIKYLFTDLVNTNKEVFSRKNI